MWIDPVTAAMERMCRYRELVPMTYEQYLDEPLPVIEWTLRIHALRDKHRRRSEDDADPRTA